MLKKKTIVNLILILFILSFFVTDIGYFGKVWLNQLFSFSPSAIAETEQVKIDDYDWKLKDAEWNFFNFKKSKDKVVFINLWASWRLPCVAELKGVQQFYNDYKDKIDFYIITDEVREDVEPFMEANNFNFPVTYLIIGEKMPIDPKEVPSSYLIDKKGNIVVHKIGIADWDSSSVYEMVDSLLEN